MKKFIFKMTLPLIALMAAACGKPEFVKEKTWDIWVANKSDIGYNTLRGLRCNTLYDVLCMLCYCAYVDDERKTIGLILYNAFENVVPLDSKGNIEKFDDNWLDNLTLYISNGSKQKFGLDISHAAQLQFVNENYTTLKAVAVEMYDAWTILYKSRLQRSVNICELGKDKERSKKGVTVYDVIYFVSIGDDSRYVQCKVLVNDKTDSEEIQIVNSSEYLLDL